MSNDLQKIAIVTGASCGIGRETIKRLLQQNVEVFAVTRKPEKFLDLAQQEQLELNESNIIEADLTETNQFSDTLAKVMNQQSKQRVDILINAVGNFSSKPILELDVEDFLTVLNNNLVSVFIAIKSVLPYLINHGGSIVNTGSILGVKSLPNTPCLAYGTAKAGVVHMTKLLAVELAPYEIRVNCVCPGILNPTYDSMQVKNYQELTSLKRYLSLQSIQRFGTPSDIASAIIFLATDESSWITGETLIVDGGMVL